jgi:GH15 family glucan-1,4-alpha-glucosidase
MGLQMSLFNVLLQKIVTIVSKETKAKTLIVKTDSNPSNHKITYKNTNINQKLKTTTVLKIGSGVNNS